MEALGPHVLVRDGHQGLRCSLQHHVGGPCGQSSGQRLDLPQNDSMGLYSGVGVFIGISGGCNPLLGSRRLSLAHCGYSTRARIGRLPFAVTRLALPCAGPIADEVAPGSLPPPPPSTLQEGPVFSPGLLSLGRATPPDLRQISEDKLTGGASGDYRYG